MNKVTPENIRLLLTRYLDGESTQKELQQLGEYLGHADRLPADLMPYAQMFALLGETQPTPSVQALDRLAADRPSPDLSLVGRGADTNGGLAGNKNNYSSPCKGEAGRRSHRLGLLLAAACIAAFAFILLAPLRLEEESMAVAYVDGKKLDDKQAAMRMGQEALQEIFSNGNQEEQLSNIFNGL